IPLGGRTSTISPFSTLQPLDIRMVAPTAITSTSESITGSITLVKLSLASRQSTSVFIQYSYLATLTPAFIASDLVPPLILSTTINRSKRGSVERNIRFTGLQGTLLT